MKPQDINLNELELALCIHSGHRQETIAYYQQFLSDKLNRIEKEIDLFLPDGLQSGSIKKAERLRLMKIMKQIFKQILRKEFTQ